MFALRGKSSRVYSRFSCERGPRTSRCSCFAMSHVFKLGCESWRAEISSCGILVYGSMASGVRVTVGSEGLGVQCIDKRGNAHPGGKRPLKPRCLLFQQCCLLEF